MLRKIIVAIDGSPSSQHVFEQALMLAQAMNSQLGLLHVTDPDEAPNQELPSYLANLLPFLDGDELQTRCYVGNFVEQNHELFGQYASQASAVNVSTECIQCFGNPEQAICDFAAAWKADLIVLGRRGRTGLAEFFLGSASNYALHHSPCSVYVVQSSTSDDSESSTNPAEVSL